MKKLVSIVLLFTFCCVFVSPREVRADSGGAAAQGALLAAVTCSVILVIVWAVSPQKESSKKTDKTDETIKVAENFRFIPENQSHKLASSLKVNNGQAILYSW